MLTEGGGDAATVAATVPLASADPTSGAVLVAAPVSACCRGEASDAGCVCVKVAVMLSVTQPTIGAAWQQYALDGRDTFAMLAVSPQVREAIMYAEPVAMFDTADNEM